MSVILSAPMEFYRRSLTFVICKQSIILPPTLLGCPVFFTIDAGITSSRTNVGLGEGNRNEKPHYSTISRIQTVQLNKSKPLPSVLPGFTVTIEDSSFSRAPYNLPQNTDRLIVSG